MYEKVTVSVNRWLAILSQCRVSCIAHTTGQYVNLQKLWKSYFQSRRATYDGHVVGFFASLALRAFFALQLCQQYIDNITLTTLYISSAFVSRKSA